jgi:hypothetical protein
MWRGAERASLLPKQGGTERDLPSSVGSQRLARNAPPRRVCGYALPTIETSGTDSHLCLPPTCQGVLNFWNVRDYVTREAFSMSRKRKAKPPRVCEISQPTVRHVLAAMMKTRALTSLTVRSRSTVSTWRALGLLVRARSPLDVHAEVLFCSHRFSEAP